VIFVLFNVQCYASCYSAEWSSVLLVLYFESLSIRAVLSNGPGPRAPEPQGAPNSPYVIIHLVK